MSFMIGLIIGFLIGWLVFKPMQWVTELFEWLKQKRAK